MGRGRFLKNIIVSGVLPNLTPLHPQPDSSVQFPPKWMYGRRDFVLLIMVVSNLLRLPQGWLVQGFCSCYIQSSWYRTFDYLIT